MLGTVPKEGASASWLLSIDLREARFRNTQVDPRPPPVSCGAYQRGEAAAAGIEVFWDGALYNGPDLSQSLGEVGSASHPAELIRLAYLRWGEGLLGRIRGVFSLVIVDRRHGSVLCARDPLGTCGLCYWFRDGRLIVSDNAAKLASELGRTSGVHRPAIGDHLLRRWPAASRTYYRDVHRLPLGHALRVTDESRLFQYWQPFTQPSERIPAPEVAERFRRLLRQAVDRALQLGSAAVYLSSGVDSTAVALASAEAAEASGKDAPHAYCLSVGDPLLDESRVQRMVAAELGLPQVQLNLEEELPGGLIPEAVAFARSMSAPLLNPWMAAFAPLGAAAARMGYRTILTGVGGDEWHSASPIVAADLLGSGNVVGWLRLYRALHRSFEVDHQAALRSLLWVDGIRPLAHGIGSGVRRLLRPAGYPSRPGGLIVDRALPGWLLPDPAVRREMDEDGADTLPEAQDRPRGFCARERQETLTHPFAAMQADELLECGRRDGLRMLKPLCDPELLEFVAQVPPSALTAGGMNKGLLRAPLTKRLPGAGFGEHRKVNPGAYFRTALFDAAPRVYQELGGTPALDSLGIVDARRLTPVFEDWISKRSQRDSDLVWTLLNLEAWSQAHA